MTTGFYFDEHCLWHTTGEYALILPVGGYVQPPTGAGHAESPESKRRFKALIDVSGMAKHVEVRSASQVTVEDMHRAHTTGYISDFRKDSMNGGGDLGFFSPFGSGSFEIAALSAGLAKQAIVDVLTGVHKNAYSLSRPPGHHCLSDQSMGFCLLSNISIAVEAARANHGLGRVAVLDWDVHHGNGTQDIYYERADTLTVSIHQENCFPPGQGTVAERGEGEGKGTNLNIPLLAGGGHQAYMDAFELLAMPAIRDFNPDIIIIASGLDANSFDPLARMQCTSETFREMTRQTMALADEICNGRVVAIHEGGYAEVVVPFCGLAIVEQLSGHRTDVQDPFLAMAQNQQPAEDFNVFQRQRLERQASEFS